jgi:hypothetical protein
MIELQNSKAQGLHPHRSSQKTGNEGETQSSKFDTCGARQSRPEHPACSSQKYFSSLSKDPRPRHQDGLPLKAKVETSDSVFASTPAKNDLASLLQNLIQL